jgi:hypothetical protein
MDEAAKIQALPLHVVRERLLNTRHDGFVMAQKPIESALEPSESAPPAKPPRPVAPPREPRICAYSKCGVKFTPSDRKDQRYHTETCRKRAWFERNFTPIVKPPEVT